MKNQIQELQKLFLSDISRETFFKLILHITNSGYGETNKSYANYLKIENWIELYKNKFIKIDVNKEQLILFLNYMIKYADFYVGKNGDYYYVTKQFTTEKRSEEFFQFESIVYQVFETIL
ncbi:hypothetical protein AB9T88_10105 [Flavobacterium sp. LBUM151]